MATNLRSRPIEGYITDSAGSVLRNVDVVIKEDAPHGGSIVVVSARSDDDGYFITTPIKNGVYDIYESGVRIIRQYHSANPTLIQCYKPNSNNIPTDIASFADFIGVSPVKNINTYRYYLQIEPETIDVSSYGNSFPLWETNSIVGTDFENIAAIHTSFNIDTEGSRLTHSRFDVEFIIAEDSRIRWSGVPGISFGSEQKIVLPLDYMSITPNHHSYYGNGIGGSIALDSGDRYIVTLNNDTVTAISTGDIIKITMSDDTPNDPHVFYGIVHHKPVPATNVVYITKWKTTKVASNSLTPATTISKCHVYNGFNSSIESLDRTIKERFSVQENLYAQNSLTELYSYSGV